LQHRETSPHAIVASAQKAGKVMDFAPRELAEFGVPLSQVYSVATFYNAFTLKPRGKCLITMCMGTACHVRGSKRVLKQVEKLLHIEPGETTPDRQFSLETVNCLGACALGPIMVVEEEYFGQMTPAKVEPNLHMYSNGEDQGENA